MSQRIKDGIIIDNSFFIIEEKKAGFPYFMRLLQLLAIIVGSWSMIHILTESFYIPVSMIQINVALVLFGLILFFLFLFPNFDVVKAVFAIGFYCLFCYSRLPRLLNGFFILENLVLSRVEDYYGYHSQPFNADYFTATPDTSLLLIMILIPVMALLTLAIIRNRYINLCNIIYFIPVSASFAFGMIPSERYLITYLIIMLYLTRSYISSHKTNNKEQKTLLQRINSRSAIWLSIMCLVIFTLMKLFVSPEKYDEVVQIKEAKSELQTFLLDFTVEDFTERFNKFKISSGNNAAGGLNGGQLGKVDQVTFSETKQLRVLAPLSAVSEGIYLKGYVGSVYTGDSWEGHSEETDKKYKELIKKLPEEKFVPINQSSLLLNMISDLKDNSAYQYLFYQGKIKVDYLGANKKYLYAPYYTDYSDLDNSKYLQDLYSAPIKKKGSYEFEFFYHFSATKGSQFPDYSGIPQRMEGYPEYEKLYRDFVYENYTKLPGTGVGRLREEFSEIGEEIGTGVMEKVNYVKKYLDQETRYSLAPGKLPKDKDFVEYFLYENKVGYCSHYASAAALILRAMGIPTRYVEGYAIGVTNINQNVLLEDQMISVYSDQMDYELETARVELSVMDSNAHAWVEVYIDGCGWIPMEFTPATGIPDTTTMAEDMLILGKEVDANPKHPETQANPTPEPTLQPDNTQNKDQPNHEDTKISDEKLLKLSKQNIFFLFGILGAAAISIALARFLLHIYRKRKEKLTKNKSKRALLLYNEIEKIIAFCKGLPKKSGCLEDNEDYVKEKCIFIEKEAFTACMETVRKARFGRDIISSEELMEVRKFHKKLYREVYHNSHLAKKIFLKFVLLA